MVRMQIFLLFLNHLMTTSSRFAIRTTLIKRRSEAPQTVNTSIQKFFDQWIGYLDLWHKPRTWWHLPSQWEIYMTHLEPTLWWELQKTRPCIVYSLQSGNRGDCVVCIPIKTFKQQPKHQFWVKILPTVTNWLDSISYASLSDIRSISKSRLWTKKWSLKPSDIERIHQYIALLFGLEKKRTSSPPFQ